ncbi:MAG: Nif3-like dinuclear metal center hexameric protein [Nitriliruptorales bacterium]|nr:Nif3-like dinuclear metal center hexameric protein [Nitriliruptorales bacterium]
MPRSRCTAALVANVQSLENSRGVRKHPGVDTADRLADWIALVDARYPERDAAAWDHVGLQVGDPRDAVTAVLVCLDVTEATLEEAGRLGADLILAHHPLLFRPLPSLTPSTAAGRLALRAARSGIAILAAHTNLDAAVPGTSDPVAAILSLTGVRALAPQSGPRPGRVKLVTFIPHDDTARVLGAMAEVGAGVIGEYDHCSFRVAGTGTFRPSAAAAPAVGERQRLNEVAEDRLEIVVTRDRLGAVVTALTGEHPYEEVAWDAYPLVDPPPPPEARDKGLGLVGMLPAPLTLRQVAATLAGRLPAPGLRVAGNLAATVRCVAVCGGAGDSLIPNALAAQADVYVTGDLRHHPALDARTMGLALIDAGHYATEAAALPAFRAALAATAGERGLRAQLLASEVSTDPWTTYPGEGESAGETS